MSVKLRLLKGLYRILRRFGMVGEHQILEHEGKIIMYRLIYTKGKTQIWKKV